MGGVPAWVRRRRVLGAFAAGVLLTLVALGAVGVFVLADQRRSARVLAAALTQALAREVQIDRVASLGTRRVVMRGVRLPRDGGWPTEIVAEQVEALGPLLLAARGEEAPVRLVVTRPTLEASQAGAVLDPAALDTLREGLQSFLTSAILLDVTLTGGSVRGAGRLTFDLAVRKGRGEAKGELTVRAEGSAPLLLVADARAEGQTIRIALVGRGPLAPVSDWLSVGSATILAEQPLDLRLDAELTPPVTLSARGRLGLGDAVAAEGEGTLQRGLLRATLPRVDADLAVAAAVAGLAGRPIGRAELVDVTVTWRPDRDALPTVAAAVRVPRLELTAAGVGSRILAAQLEARVTVEPATSGAVAHGTARAARLQAAGVDLAPAETRYRLSLNGHGAITRADLDGLAVRLAGAALTGSLGYDGARGRLDARFAGEAVEAAELVRSLAPGWLEATDRLQVAGLQVAAIGLDPIGLRAGALRLEARSVALHRPAGDVTTGRTAVGATLGEPAVALAIEADGVSGTLAAFRGSVPRLVASAELGRGPAGGVSPQRAALAVRDREGRELLTATLRPSGPAGGGRAAVSARAPELQRLGGLWPEIERRLNGTASLDVELAGPGWRAADGRLTLSVPEAVLQGGKVAVRDLEAALPLRRGTETPGAPPWGRIAAGELIAYGVVARDVTTPARVWNDRLALNDLRYALYAGEGKGWAEVELEAAGPLVRGELTGERVPIEEFIGAYGIRGGTMTGLLRYELDVLYRAGRLGVNGRLDVPQGGTVNIELLNRLLVYAGADPTGVLRSALENLRAFDYKAADADVRSGGDNILVSLALRGRERFGIFPPRVREINVRNMPLDFLARQFPGR